MRRRTIRAMVLGAAAALLVGCQTTAPRLDGPAAPGDRGRRASLLAVAERQLGVPYRYGGSDAEGFDCSGLVYYSHRRVGVTVPRTAAAQQRAAERVPLHRLRAGDLVFFRIEGAKGRHVGIYAGDGRFIHAPSRGKRVSHGDLDNPYWRARLTGAGSYF